MALGSVAVSGGMSKKAKERLMYMDGKLVWSTAMGSSGGGATEVRVARGGSAATNILQYNGSYTLTKYVTVTFASDGTIRLSYPCNSLNGCISVEGYQYL